MVVQGENGRGCTVCEWAWLYSVCMGVIVQGENGRGCTVCEWAWLYSVGMGVVVQYEWAWLYSMNRRGCTVCYLQNAKILFLSKLLVRETARANHVPEFGCKDRLPDFDVRCLCSLSIRENDSVMVIYFSTVLSMKSDSELQRIQQVLNVYQLFF